MIKLYTIGFTRKNAETFFGLLKSAQVTRLLDIRLNNSSQLSGFAKRDDLAYFLREICGAAYTHQPDFAPTETILKAYKTKQISWAEYESEFDALMQSRKIERSNNPAFYHQTCLLCSEHEPDQCHRRLVAEYLQEKISDLHIRHLG